LTGPPGRRKAPGRDPGSLHDNRNRRPDPSGGPIIGGLAITARSTRSTIRFTAPFRLAGSPDPLPAGSYDVIAEAERLEGLSFDAWHVTATFLLVRRAGRTEMRPVDPADLDRALGRDGQPPCFYGEAAPSPLEDNP
jgi:hypothetical protein